jgi:hypothetical protein
MGLTDLNDPLVKAAAQRHFCYCATELRSLVNPTA